MDFFLLEKQWEREEAVIRRELMKARIWFVGLLGDAGRGERNHEEEREVRFVALPWSMGY